MFFVLFLAKRENTCRKEWWSVIKINNNSFTEQDPIQEDANFDNILANNDLDEDNNSHNEDSLQEQKQLRWRRRGWRIKRKQGDLTQARTQEDPGTYMEPTHPQEELGETAIKEESYKGPETEKRVFETDRDNKLGAKKG